MRNTKEILKLETYKADVMALAPKGSPTRWENWVESLIEVLEQNGLGLGWEYDVESGTFQRNLIEVAQVGEFRGDLSIRVDLDPRASLSDEITRLIELRAQFRQTCAATIPPRRF